MRSISSDEFSWADHRLLIQANRYYNNPSSPPNVTKDATIMWMHQEEYLCWLIEYKQAREERRKEKAQVWVNQYLAKQLVNALIGKFYE
jgi:hypothetical protein